MTRSQKKPTAADLGYEFCPVALDPNPTPHSSHTMPSGLRCPGAPERDDRARTFDPKGGRR